MVAPIPATKPTERSISLRISAKVSPRPNVTKKAACTSRLTMLPAERNLDCWTWKMMMMRTSPRMIGSAPLSPLRIRFTQALTYSPSESARISGATETRATAAGVSSSCCSSRRVSWCSSVGGAVLGSALVSVPAVGLSTLPA